MQGKIYKRKLGWGEIVRQPLSRATESGNLRTMKISKPYLSEERFSYGLFDHVNMLGDEITDPAEIAYWLLRFEHARS